MYNYRDYVIHTVKLHDGPNNFDVAYKIDGCLKPFESLDKAEQFIDNIWSCHYQQTIGDLKRLIIVHKKNTLFVNVLKLASDAIEEVANRE